MPSTSLERRVTAIETARNSRRSVADYTDAELLARIGWAGALPPTDEELQAIADGKRGGNHVNAD